MTTVNSTIETSGMRFVSPLMGKSPPPPPEKRCILVVSHLEPAKGWQLTHPNKDFKVDMSSRETLVTLIDSVIEEGFERMEEEVDDTNAADATANQDTGGPPRWVMSFNKVMYKYQGWVLSHESQISIDFRQELADSRTGKAPPLDGMVYKFKSGLHGLVQSQAGRFEFRLQTIKKTKVSPVFEIQAVEPTFSGKLERDFLSQHTIMRAGGLRSDFDTYYTRQNAWRRKNDSSDDYEPCLPERPTWSSQELELVALLFLGAGSKKFHKAWLAVMRFGIFGHRQSDVMDRWKEMELGYIEHRALLEGIQEKYSTKKAMIIASKHLALKLLEQKLMLGTPMPQPKPEKRRRLE